MNSRFAAAAWGLIVAAALVAAPLALRGRLPDPLAVHWRSGLVPDGEHSFTAFLVVSVVTWGVAWAVLFGVAVNGKAMERRLSRMYWWGSLAGMGVFALGMSGATLLANLDVPTWREADLEGRTVLVVIGAALAAALLAGYLGRGGLDQRPPVGEEPPRLRLQPGQRSVWVSRITNSWLTAMSMAAAVALAVAGVLAITGVLAGLPAGGTVPGLGIVLFAGLLTSSLTARVTRDGLAIGFGPLGWPVRRIRLSKIDKAWSESRYPSQVGGWGLRGLPGSATIMLRGGECLIIRYRSGGQLAVSIDDAERGAALINAFIAERPAVQA
ncbi:hypothetical protein ACIBO2_08240 [Nonomuraea sp. NPDC050022]|uniref:hypothetical protein n=1 Tax=unclassified Nonomuraea TaxID=2593643 RepID=UPI0033CC0698